MTNAQVLVLLVAFCAWLCLVGWWLTRRIAASEARLRRDADRWGGLHDARVVALREWLKDEAEARREVPVVVEAPRMLGAVAPVEPPAVDFSQPAPVRRGVPASPSLPREPQATLVLMDAHEMTEQGRMTVSARRRPREVKHDDATYVQSSTTPDGHFIYRRER